MPERKKGYLAYNEVNDLIPNDVRSPEDLDLALATIGTLGIDVLEGQPKLPSALEKGVGERSGGQRQSRARPDARRP